MAPLAPDGVVVPASESTATQADPVEFSARWSFGAALPGGGYDIGEDGWYRGNDLGWAPSVIEPGDPRHDGDLTLRASPLQKGGIEIWNGAFRIENEQGAWQKQPIVQSVKLADARDPMTWTAVLDGEGEYAGLTAIVGITRFGGGWDVEGMIIDGSLPPAPTILTRE